MVRCIAGSVGVLVWALGSAWTLVALAEGTTLQLKWDAPPECPSQAAAERATLALVGQLQAPYSAEIQLVPVGQLWVGVLRTGGAVRELRTTTCREAAQALIVILALAINPHASVPQDPLGAAEPTDAVRAPAPHGAPSVTANTPSARAPTDDADLRALEPAARIVRPEAERTRWGLALTFFGNAGVLPSPTLGAGLGIRYGSSKAYAELGVLAALPRSKELSDGTGHGGTFDWESARLTGALALPGPRWCFVAAGLDVGRLAGRGFGVDHATTGQSLWLGLLAGVRVRPVSTASVDVDIGLQAGMPLLRPVFGLDGIGPVYQPSWVQGWVDWTLVWR